ncbi:glycine cleavage system protein GcvH [Candidatus Bipolaricaulota bacterium]|nr:glycine cleavage system protein GcvH [Candidatus Bipolaricaulota bacterium]RLE29384.1 MAG: glycine cleavage system protein GcvH [Candidatus Acetothermia bacterium]
MVPQELRYTKTHEWVKVEDGTARIGITDYAQKKLGDVVYVELPEKGRKLKKGEVAVTVESVKAAESVYAPVSGEVVEVNEELISTPGTINRDPYGNGWLFALKMENEAELSELLDAEGYKNLIGE